ncbi:MAG: hypothetical protein ACREFQ_11350 [Stellaceae bacterium]
MRIYTVTCDGRPAAVVRAENPADAIEGARTLGEVVGLHGHLLAREPNDAEMVSWLAHRDDHMLPEFIPYAVAS